MTATSTFVLALSVTLAWGAFAFGAVYPWGYWPLLLAAQGLGVWGLMARHPEGPVRLKTDTTNGRLNADTSNGRTSVRWWPRGVMAGLVLTLIAVQIQLVPLPAPTLERVSASTHHVSQLYDIVYATQGTNHSLSISPQATWLGALFIASFALLFAGTLRVLSFGASRSIAVSIVIVGAALAMAGIIQKPLFTGKIFGFWEPHATGGVFGPFVNKNHFAGWMVMGLGVALGYFSGRIGRAMRRVGPTFRERLLWLSSPDASQILLVAGGIVAMALALVLTLSRSGIGCLVVSVALTGVLVIARQRGSRRAVVAGYLAVMTGLVFTWVGVDIVIQRFVAADWNEFNNRFGAWRDGWSVARSFMPFGSGFNTYGVATLFYQTIDPARHYAQAHNDYVQLLAEGGLLVGIPAVLTMVAFAAAVRRRFRAGSDDTLTWWIRAGAVTGLLAIALQEFVDFSLQIPGNAALFAVLAALAVHRAPARVQNHLRPVT